MTVMVGAILGGPEQLLSDFVRIKSEVNSELRTLLSSTPIILEYSLDLVLHIPGSIIKNVLPENLIGKVSLKQKKVQVNIPLAKEHISDRLVIFGAVSDAVVFAGEYLSRKKKVDVLPYLTLSKLLLRSIHE